VRFTVRVRGRGRVRIAAYGVADAEHLVEKELTRLWPGAVVRIEGIARAGPDGIVEEFDVAYRVEGEQEVTAEGEADAAPSAFRQLRHMLADSRYGRTAWEGRMVKGE
jgi:hypothetical protein